MHNVAYATAIYDLFRKNKDSSDEEIRTFLKKKLILPLDVTMILEDKLIEAQRQQQIGSKILDLMVTVLGSDIDKSLEMEAQILYTTCSLGRSDTFRGQQLKQIILKKHNWIMQEMKNANDNERKLLMLECRTQCIVLSYFFGEEDNLAWYNETLLEDDGTSTANIAFHFYYYSGRLFTFWDVASFDLENAYDEMLYNTYYVLEKFLRTRSNDLGLTNQFVLHNFITFMQLYTRVILPSGKYQQIANKIKSVCLSYKKAYEKVSPGSIKFYNKLLELIRSINL